MGPAELVFALPPGVGPAVWDQENPVVGSGDRLQVDRRFAGGVEELAVTARLGQRCEKETDAGGTMGEIGQDDVLVLTKLPVAPALVGETAGEKLAPGGGRGGCRAGIA